MGTYIVVCHGNGVELTMTYMILNRYFPPRSLETSKFIMHESLVPLGTGIWRYANINKIKRPETIGDQQMIL